MNVVDQKLAAGRFRLALDMATLEAIALRAGLDLGDIPVRLHQLRDEVAKIDDQLDQAVREHFERKMK